MSLLFSLMLLFIMMLSLPHIFYHDKKYTIPFKGSGIPLGEYPYEALLYPHINPIDYAGFVYE